MSKLKVSKTLYWKTAAGDVVELDDLPGSIRQQIEIFDAMREDLTDIKYQEQVYSLALSAKKQQIDQILASMANAQAAQAAQENSAPAQSEQTVPESTEE